MRKPRDRLFIGIAVVAMFLGGETGNAQTSPGDAACAQREIALAMLVEAQGAAPNASSAILDDNAAALMSARTACDNETAAAALAVYDRLISELTASLQTQK